MYVLVCAIRSMNLRCPAWSCSLVLAAAALLTVDFNTCSVHYVDSFSFSPTFLPLSQARCKGKVELQATQNANEGFIEVDRQRRGSDGHTYTKPSKHRLAYRIARPMALSSRQAAPIVVLHGGPSLPSSYLYPLENVVPYRSIVFYDQLGCGRSDEPADMSLYSIEDSVRDLKTLLKHLGVRRFHLYGQSYGGILAFEYLKSVAMASSSSSSSSPTALADDDGECKCLSAILSSAPTNIAELENDFFRLYEELAEGGTQVHVSMGNWTSYFAKNINVEYPKCPRFSRTPTTMQGPCGVASTLLLHMWRVLLPRVRRSCLQL